MNFTRFNCTIDLMTEKSKYQDYFFTLLHESLCLFCHFQHILKNLDSNQHYKLQIAAVTSAIFNQKILIGEYTTAMSFTLGGNTSWWFLFFIELCHRSGSSLMYCVFIFLISRVCISMNYSLVYDLWFFFLYDKEKYFWSCCFVFLFLNVLTLYVNSLVNHVQ